METQLAKKDFDATAETILANAIVVAWQRDATGMSWEPGNGHFAGNCPSCKAPCLMGSHQ